MLEKIKVLFFVLVGVLFLTLADGFVVDAAEVDWEAVDVSAYISDKPYYYASEIDGVLYYVFATAPIYVCDNSTIKWGVCFDGNAIYSRVYTSDYGASWKFLEKDIVSTGSTSFGFGYKETNIYCNHDIKHIDTGEVVFLAPVPPLVMVARGIQPVAVQKEILAMIPLLIPLLAGYLGLRKALRMLSRILRTA